MQSDLPRIWTGVAVSISNDDNDYIAAPPMRYYRFLNVYSVCRCFSIKKMLTCMAVLKFFDIFIRRLVSTVCLSLTAGRQLKIEEKANFWRNQKKSFRETMTHLGHFSVFRFGDMRELRAVTHVLYFTLLHRNINGMCLCLFARSARVVECTDCISSGRWVRLLQRVSCSPVCWGYRMHRLDDKTQPTSVL